MIRDRLIRWLGGIVRDPMATPECQHSWTNWSDPAPKAVRTIKWNGGDQDEEKVCQDRRCVKCNLYEWRVV